MQKPPAPSCKSLACRGLRLIQDGGGEPAQVAVAGVNPRLRRTKADDVAALIFLELVAREGAERLASDQRLVTGDAELLTIRAGVGVNALDHIVLGGATLARKDGERPILSFGGAVVVVPLDGDGYGERAIPLLLGLGGEGVVVTGVFIHIRYLLQGQFTLGCGDCQGLLSF